jgi:hypothetical protein
MTGMPKTTNFTLNRKRMNRLLLFTLFAFLLISSFGCRKDSVISDTDITNTPEPETLASVDVYGRITDLDGTPLENATVTLEMQSTQTDENGFYQLTAVTNGQHAVLSIEKEAYFSTYPAFAPPKEGRKLVDAQLYPRVLVASFSANVGGEWTTPDGIRVVFPFGPSAYLRPSDGYDYQQTVEVYAHYLDPTDPQLASRMPGNLLAINEDGNQQGLLTFGMVNVELQTTEGEPLEMQKPAWLEMPVPTSLQANAPAQIPLWYFDEPSGLWVEEGTASLEDGKYKGQVSHFTFWNCDVPTDFIWLSGQVSLDGQFVPVQVRVTWISQGAPNSTLTSDRGFFDGWVPNNELLLLEIIGPCGTIIYSENIGPFSQDTQLPLIEAETNGSWMDITGAVVDCEGEPVQNGYGLTSLGLNTYIMPCDENGAFEGYYPICGAAEGSAMGVDLDNSLISASISYPPEEVIDLGSIVACDQQLIPQIVVQYSGNTTVISDVSVFIEDLGTGILYSFSGTATYSPDDQVQYEISIIDWNDNPNDPLYAMSTQFTLVGNPPEALMIDATASDIEALYIGTGPGDYVEFEISNATILEDVSGQQYTDGQVTLTGIITD